MYLLITDLVEDFEKLRFLSPFFVEAVVPNTIDTVLIWYLVIKNMTNPGGLLRCLKRGKN